MTRQLRSLLLIAALALSGAVPAWGQTALDTTTITAPVTDSANQIVVASASNIEVGDTIFIDREAMRVRAINGLYLTVSRGVSGSPAQGHVDNAHVYIGAGGDGDELRFYSSSPGGSCTRSSERFLPRVVPNTGYVYDCLAGVWTVIRGQRSQRTVEFVQGGTAADALDTIFFIADRPYTVTRVDAIWATAESTGAMDIMVEKLTGTTACASGTDLLSAVIDATGTANTVNNGSLTATTADLLLAAGNRLCVDLSATPNEVVNMVVTVTLDAQ
jgi:hypothetical protein